MYVDPAPFEIKLEYHFSCPELLTQALTHPSAGVNNNQRLEFLGDAVLQMVISEALYAMDRHLDEGQMTFLRAKQVCENTLAGVAGRLDLGRYLIFAKNGDTGGIRGHAGPLADAMEAVLAAVYLDGGYAAVSGLIHRLWDFASAVPDAQEDSKSALQILLQSLGEPVPEYKTISAEGPAHKRFFTVAVYRQGAEIASGSGKTKKLAEQQAALAALTLLRREGTV
jgi:ribonuclease III